MDRDERDVQKIIATVVEMQNSFNLDSIPNELVNIVTGQVASEKVAKELSCFLQDGVKQSTAFIEERLAKSTRSRSFWDPEKRKQCATFIDMKKSFEASTRKVHMDSDVFFRGLLASCCSYFLLLSKQREVSMETVMSHELAAVPFHCLMMMEASGKQQRLTLLRQLRL